MADVYAIHSGAYSDWTVWCIFEREEDADLYLIAQGYVFDPAASPGGHHQPYMKQTEYGYAAEAGIMEFQFWPAGVIPHADA